MPFDVPDTFTEGCSWPKNTETAKNRKRVQGGWMLLLLANVWQEKLLAVADLPCNKRDQSLPTSPREKRAPWNFLTHKR